MIIPFISIVLPIRNEEKYIEQTLHSILQQTYPAECFEILIADGISTDATRKIIKKFQSENHNIFLFDNPGKIVPTGLNILIQQAKGQVIVRVDGHTIIEPNYLHECVNALERTDADNVGGRMNAIGENLFGEVVAIATSSPFGVGGARFHFSDKEEWVDTVYMGGWRKIVFEKIGLFDEELVRDQDDEFNYRLREAGGKILLSPKIKSHYTVRGTPRKLWKQYFQYGYWKIRVMQKHPKQMSLRQFIPAAFVVAILIAVLLTISFPMGWILLALFTGSYLLANGLASIVAASSTSWKYFSLLPVVFAILHTSYGLGFWVGLVKFWNRWGDKLGKTPTFE